MRGAHESYLKLGEAIGAGKGTRQANYAVAVWDSYGPLPGVQPVLL